MNTKTFLLALCLIAFCKQNINAQSGFSNEIGIITGPVALFSDYGNRAEIETNIGNTSIGFGIVHYINFAYRSDCKCYTQNTYFNDHFKIRNELDYHKTQLQHYGAALDPNNNDLNSRQLRAISASTRVIEIGSQLEYYPLSIRDFSANSYPLAPFVSLGLHYVNFDPEASSSLGKLNTAFTTPDKYINAFQQQGGSTWGVVWSIGVRYKLNSMSDLMLDSRWTSYFSDWVDGLNPSFENNGTTPVPENKANDWMYWLNFGYIYYLD